MYQNDVLLDTNTGLHVLTTEMIARIVHPLFLERFINSFQNNNLLSNDVYNVHNDVIMFIT